MAPEEGEGFLHCSSATYMFYGHKQITNLYNVAFLPGRVAMRINRDKDRMHIM